MLPLYRIWWVLATTSRIIYQEVPKTPVEPQEKGSILGGPLDMALIQVVNVGSQCFTAFKCQIMEMQFGGEFAVIFFIAFF